MARGGARLPYLDIAKGIGIIFVVLGHCSSRLTNYWMYGFHVPLFFVISGLLFDLSKYDKITFLKKRCKSLLIPLLFWDILQGLLLNQIPNHDHFKIGVLWFLLVLFFAEIFFL